MSAATQRTLRELPPRHLDWYTQAVLLFGDYLSQAGWAMLAIGSVFFWITSVNSEAKMLLQERTVHWQEKAGVILEADSTMAVQDGKRVWKYKHSFGLDGEKYLGESYSVGKKFDAGQIAYIRYDADNPTTNYLIGLRRSKYSWRVNLFLLVPALGLLLALYPIRQNLRFLRVLKIGDFTRGKLVGKTATKQSRTHGGTVLPVFKYNFEFEHNGTKYIATCRTHRTNLVEDEASEIILYDRYRPTLNIVYDAVADAPDIQASGKMGRAPGWKAWVLFLPAFTVVVNGVYLLFG
ncbi:MAG: hypothetical protein R2830_11685 [Saprospiraceae bacterium]